MRKFLISCCILLSLNGYSQDSLYSFQNLKDSSALLDELMSLLDSSYKTTSHVQVSVGIGNRLFSVNNNSLNSKQTTSTIVYTPTLGYFHKSGFSISASAYLLNDPAKGFGIDQYSFTPAYELPENKKFDFSASYTYYVVKDKFSVYSSPVQHDLYATFGYKKPWLEPGVAVGYSTGEYKQAFYRDTTIGVIHRHFYDTITNHLESFSVMATLGHTFDWYNIFNKKDGILFAPTLMLNMGSGTTTLTHKTNAPNFIKFLIKRGKIAKLQTAPFEVQSAGLSLDLNYTIGKFTIAPQGYLDYYIPDTDEKRFTQAYTLSLSYRF